MPSLTATRLQLTVTGGSATFEPARLTASHLRLVFSGGQAVLGPGTGSIALEPITLKLDRRQRQTTYFDAQGRPTAQEQWLHQRICEALEAFAAAVGTQIVDLNNLLSQVLAANALATAANQTATSVQQASSLAGSYTDPVSVLSADNTGTVTVAAHTRRYLDGTSASVNGGSVGGFANGAFVTIYYVDAGREGGAVTYQGTTGAVSQEGSTHIVGGVTIPQAGDPPASGTGPTAPGFNPPDDFDNFDPGYIEP